MVTRPARDPDGQCVLAVLLPISYIECCVQVSSARMAKLADALASGASGREVVQVQVLFRAQKPQMPPVLEVAFLFLCCYLNLTRVDSLQ
jgi:hypothetical protein